MRTYLPTSTYLLSLQSDKSRTIMSSRLKGIATRLQNTSHVDLDWGKIGYTEVLSLVNTLQKEDKAPDTINSYLAAIKGAAKEAWRGKVISMEDYHLIKEVKKVAGSRTSKGRAITIAELRKLVSFQEDDYITVRDSAIIALTYGAGLRRQEVADLKVADLNLETGEITILGKRNKQAVNRLPESSLKVVKRWLAVRGNAAGSLFLRINKGNKLTNKGVSDQSIYNIVKQRQKDAGIDKVSPHDLRRSYITHLLEAGNDVFTVQGLARHSDVNTTQTYDRRNKSVQDNAARGLSF